MTQTDKPRVCILTTSHGLKDDRIFHKEALSLERLGFDVCIVAPCDSAEAIGSIRVLPLRSAQGRFNRHVGNVFDAMKRVWRTPADVYHLHDPELLLLGVLLKVLGNKVIYDAHENYKEKLLAKRLPHFVKTPAGALWWLWEKNASRCFDHVLAADSHIQERFGKGRCTVIANYVPLRFGQVESTKPNDGIFRIIYAGGVEINRGILKLLDAIDRLGLPTIELHLAGKIGDAALADTLKRHPQVVHHGFLPWDKVNEFMAIGDLGTLLLQPVSGYPKISGEGIVKLYEYMAVGLPVLISDFPKLKTLIESLGCGTAVDPTSPAAIAAAIDRLHRNPALRRQMSAAGQEAVRSQCNWEREEEKLLDVYNRVLRAR
jgi:glycosyltransferase involved in cell wall biosynthesis